MTTPLQFSIYLDDDEYAIEGDYTSGSPGVTSGPWENAEEPVSPEFEITSIKLYGLELGEHEIRPLDLIRLNEACLEAAEKAIDILRGKDEEYQAQTWSEE